MNKDAYITSLKRRYDFPAWKKAQRLDSELHVWRFRFAGPELPGLVPVRIEPAETTPGAGFMLHIEDKKAPAAEQAESDVLSAQPRLTKSFWRPVAMPKALINVDAYECASREACHEFLVHILGEFQSTKLERRDDLEIGDVAFAVPGGAALAFARANLAYLVRNASRQTIDVTQIARELDQQLAARPASDEEARPAIREVTSGRYRLSVPSSEGAPEPPLYFMLFSSAGTLKGSAAEIVLEPKKKTDTYEVQVVAVFPDKRQSLSKLRLGKRKPSKATD
jgi:hypothetical protein